MPGQSVLYLDKVYIPLAELDPNVIWDDSTSPGGVVLKSFNGEKPIIYTNDYQEYDSKNDHKREGYIIFFDNKKLGERVATAFAHAVKLCGGGNKSKEPF